MKNKCCTILEIKNNIDILLDNLESDNTFFNIKDSLSNITIKNNNTISKSIYLLFLDNNYKSIKISGNIKKMANLNLYTIFISNKIKVNLDINLSDDDSKIIHKSLLISKDKTNQVINLNFENTNGKNIISQDIFAISKGKGKAIVNCSGKICKESSKAENTQNLKGINLDDSSIHLNPILLIDNYDVKASHSASVGSFSDNDIFYLESRGIDKFMAKLLLLKGYIEPFISNLKNDEIKKIINKEIEKIYEVKK